MIYDELLEEYMALYKEEIESLTTRAGEVEETYPLLSEFYLEEAEHLENWIKDAS